MGTNNIDVKKIRTCNIENQIEKKERYRDELLELTNQNPNVGRKKLREKNPGIFSWLYGNDKEWLFNNLPEKKSTVSYTTRVDWEARDDMILKDVKDLLKEINNSNQKPERITLSNIGGKLNQRDVFHQNIKKLPKTKEFLEGSCESISVYKKRRIEWARKQLEAEKASFGEWEVYRRAGVVKADLEKL